jgi:hypothetical protein
MSLCHACGHEFDRCFDCGIAHGRCVIPVMRTKEDSPPGSTIWIGERDNPSGHAPHRHRGFPSACSTRVENIS